MKAREVKAAFITDVDFEPNFDEVTVYKRPSDKERSGMGKGRENDPRGKGDADKWGYNDYPMDRKKVKERMMRHAEKDIKRLEENKG